MFRNESVRRELDGPARISLPEKYIHVSCRLLFDHFVLDIDIANKEEVKRLSQFVSEPPQGR